MLDFLPEKDEQSVETEEVNLYLQLEQSLGNYYYFEQNYPDNKIDEDILPDVKKMYPNLSESEQEEKVEDIRARVKFYRFLKNKYAEIKEKMLVPAPPPLQVDEKDYDLPKTWEYVDTGADKPLIIQKSVELWKQSTRF